MAESLTYAKLLASMDALNAFMRDNPPPSEYRFYENVNLIEPTGEFRYTGETTPWRVPLSTGGFMTLNCHKREPTFRPMRNAIECDGATLGQPGVKMIFAHPQVMNEIRRVMRHG
jgi:hypothetical protein